MKNILMAVLASGALAAYGDDGSDKLSSVDLEIFCLQEALSPYGVVDNRLKRVLEVYTKEKTWRERWASAMAEAGLTRSATKGCRNYIYKVSGVT